MSLFGCVLFSLRSIAAAAAITHKSKSNPNSFFSHQHSAGAPAFNKNKIPFNPLTLHEFHLFYFGVRAQLLFNQQSTLNFFSHSEEKRNGVDLIE